MTPSLPPSPPPGGQVSQEEEERELRRRQRVERKLQELQEIERQGDAKPEQQEHFDMIEFAETYFNMHERVPEGEWAGKG